MKTNLGGKFLALIDEQQEIFKWTVFEKIYKRSTLNISYSTTRNMRAHIAMHDMKILSKKDDDEQEVTCKCRANGPPCPLGGECQISSIVYKATVTNKDG